MDTDKTPHCYIIAGSNGAGKTTFALKYLPFFVSCCDFINADEIAKGISPLDFESGLLQASKIFLKNLNRKIAERKDFSFETTLSGKTYRSRIEQWRNAGWKVILIYLYVPNAEFSAMRVKQRVMQGGHNIPLTDIKRRYARSLRNLFEYAEICDLTYCFDNTENKIISIFEKRIGEPIEIQNKEKFFAIQEFLKHD